MTEEPPKEPSPDARQPDTPAGEAEEVAVDGEAEEAVVGEVDGEAVNQDTGPESPSQDELREQLESEIAKVQVEDLILQSTVSILNLAARRIAKDDERDLAQGKAGSAATRSLLKHLPEEARERVQEALSELQLLYAREAAGGGKPEVPDNP